MAKKKSDEFQENPALFIKSFLENLVETSPENRFFLIDDSPIFTAPLVGFADGNDPLFYEYKEKIIGPFHMTPREILENSLSLAGAGSNTDLSEISVICWAIPIIKRTRATNASRDTWPSLRWAHTRDYGERFNVSLRRELVSLLTRQGYLAVAPMLSPLWKELPNYPGGPVSKWSERHALYAAGLGTFGLCDGFISEVGKAIRCGSVVVNMRLPANPRPYKTHTENCLFFTDKSSCGICIDRCPAGAITKRGHNKALCIGYLMENGRNLSARYGVEHAGCGLCQTKVPCESRIPPKHQ